MCSLSSPLLSSAPTIPPRRHISPPTTKSSAGLISSEKGPKRRWGQVHFEGEEEDVREVPLQGKCQGSVQGRHEATPGRDEEHVDGTIPKLLGHVLHCHEQVGVKHIGHLHYHCHGDTPRRCARRPVFFQENNLNFSRTSIKYKIIRFSCPDNDITIYHIWCMLYLPPSSREESTSKGAVAFFFAVAQFAPMFLDRLAE